MSAQTFLCLPSFLDKPKIVYYWRVGTLSLLSNAPGRIPQSKPRQKWGHEKVQINCIKTYKKSLKNKFQNILKIIQFNSLHVFVFKNITFIHLNIFQYFLQLPGNSATHRLQRAAGNRSFSQRPKCRREVRKIFLLQIREYPKQPTLFVLFEYRIWCVKHFANVCESIQECNRRFKVVME